MEALQNKCTGALTHNPSLITILYKLAGVPMSEFEEKTPPKLPLPVPKSKNGSEEEPDEEGGEDETRRKGLRKKRRQQSNHRDPWIRGYKN